MIGMPVTDPQFARSEVLRIFNQDQVYLLLGAAITTVGLLATALSLLRRRVDRLILWFAAFAVLYGVRLIIEYQPLWAFDVRANFFTNALTRIGLAINYLVPIPAFFFFEALDMLGRAARIVVNIVWPIALCLAVASVTFGYRRSIDDINSFLVTAALFIIVVALLRVGRGSADITLIRGGLLFFSACAVYNNIVRLFPHYYNIEPFSFVVLLACLGVVAGRRTLAQEQQLSVIQKELEIAKRIQLSILPTAFPASRSFCVTARYLPMTSVAGDFYDFLVTSDDEAGLLIADVSGHGVPAALIASMVKLAATSQRAYGGNPSELLLGMNTTLCGQTQSQFVTAGYVYLNAPLNELRYSAAAHPPMLLVRGDEVTEITENGLMLAAFSFATYTTLTLPIQRGDRFVLYTDGMLEATNRDEEEFGAERLRGLVRETSRLSYTEAADHIIASIQQWAAVQNDDLTIILCDYMA